MNKWIRTRRLSIKNSLWFIQVFPIEHLTVFTPEELELHIRGDVTVHPPPYTLNSKLSLYRRLIDPCIYRV